MNPLHVYDEPVPVLSRVESVMCHAGQACSEKTLSGRHCFFENTYTVLVLTKCTYPPRVQTSNVVHGYEHVSTGAVIEPLCTHTDNTWFSDFC